MSLLRGPSGTFGSATRSTRPPSQSDLQRLTRDPLTGLMLAPAFLAVLEHVLSRGEQHGSPTSVLLLWRPVVADAQGDDEVLVRTTRWLRKVLRGEDALARIGDAFLVCLCDTPPAGAQVVVNRLTQGMSQAEGLSDYGAWSVHCIAAQPNETARQVVDRLTAHVPALSSKVLPKESKGWFSRR